MKNILRRLRGALGNAVVWASVWFISGFAFLAGITAIASGPLGIAWEAALTFASVMAGVGFVTGGMFSGYVMAAFRNRKLEDLSAGRFAVGGGLVAVLLIPTLFGAVGVFVLGYEAPPIDWLIQSGLFSATLGSLTGFGSIKLAQKALPPSETSPKELEPGGG